MSRTPTKTPPVDHEDASPRAGSKRRGPPGDGPPPPTAPPPPPPSPETPLSDEARVRYLNYALSVITSRALPDVRDGLKPVQRRILLTMRRDLSLTPDARYRKSAKIVGDVMGNYHPHGDSSIYEAMVRMAQPWIMRAPLVDGQGNFGSPDGDGAAAYRYTEAKLRPIALELLSELERRTVAWRPSYDGTKIEPVVLPARFPHLLVNGAQGIAVGMATCIPPHNPGEVIDACVAQIDAGKELLPTKALMKFVKGPDFPTGAQLFASKDELHSVYESGSGSLRMRGEYKTEDLKNGTQVIVITSLPYGVIRGALVEKIAEIIIGKKLSPLLDVRDESTTEVRIVLEIKKGTDPQLVMAYVFKNTPMQSTFSVNLTCLVPSEQPPQKPDADAKMQASRNFEETVPAGPQRLSLGAMIRYFLDFRMLTVERRIGFDLGQLQKRIHILEGFAKVFDALDEVIRIIRKSDGKADAAIKLMGRFGFTEEQTEAILELRLYRLAKLEILAIQNELDAKRKEARTLEGFLKSEAKRWGLIKTELLEIKTAYGDKRRTKVVGAADEPEYAAEDFIVAEDANVVLSSQGWIKRVREIKDLSTTRTREGDVVLAAIAGSTRASVAFLSNVGGCYVMLIHDVPSTTGYGDPIQKFFKLADGEKIVAMLSFDPRVLDVPPAAESGDPQPPYAVAVTRSGLSFRFSLSAHRDVSTRVGRRYCKLNDGDEVVMVGVVGGSDSVLAVTSNGFALSVPVSELALLGGAGKGSMLIKLKGEHKVVGAGIVLSARDTVAAETPKGKVIDITRQSVQGHRGGEGKPVEGATRDGFVRVNPPPPAIPTLETN